LFFSNLKLKALDNRENFNTTIIPTFQQFDMVWRKVPQRGRKKHEPTFTGPHVIINKLGDHTYEITSLHKIALTKVSINDLKIFQVPDTKYWRINPRYLEQAKQALNIPKERKIRVILDYLNLNRLFYLVLQNLDEGLAIVVPNWPAVIWFKPLKQQLHRYGFKLPKQPDLFLDKMDNSIGLLAWDNWFYFSQNN
jgi:hypothetical protein